MPRHFPRRGRGRWFTHMGRPTFADDFKVSDEATVRFGEAGFLEWSTNDANANCLVLGLPEGGAVDVPVFAIGIGIRDTDLGLFNGLTQTTLAVVDADKDSYVKIDHSADDTGRITVGGTSATLGISAATTNIAASTLATIYGAATQIGYDGSAYMKIAVAETTGVVTITHAGSGKAIGWTSTGGLTFTGAFEVVGATTLDALTLSDVLTFSDGATIDNSSSTTLTLTEDNIAVAGAFSVTGKMQFGGETDWGTGATGVLIDGTGYDWASQTIARVNSDINNTAAAAAHHALSVTVSQGNSNSFFGTWTELYFSDNVDLTGADNNAAVWGQIEAGDNVTFFDTGCFTAGGYFNVIGGTTTVIGSGHSLNGVRAQLEVAAITNNGRTAAFECLKSGGVDWDYGLYIADTTTGIDIGSCTTGINFSGTITDGKCIDFAGVTLAAGSDNNLFSYGDWGSGSGAVEVAITDYWFPIRMNVASVANPGSHVLGSLMFLKFAATTLDQANLDIQGIGMTVTVSKNVGYAHAIEGLVLVDNTALTTNYGTLIGGKFTVELAESVTVTTGVGDNASAVLGLMKGLGVYAGGTVFSCFEARKESATAIDNGLWVNALTGATITNGVHFGGAGTITHALRFDSSACTIATGKTPTYSGTIATVRCDIDGTDYYLVLATTVT